MATLLFDLLTEREELLDAETMSLRFDIGLLAERLVGVTDWIAGQPETRELRLGYFGSSTGAAAALIAAALRPGLCAAVVSRGGRPDLAQPVLGKVETPTLFVVGGEDYDVLELNERAMAALRCEKELVIIEGATHLFSEPGALHQVTRVAADWFARHLGAAAVEAQPQP
jgi:dipeptidyl aminopeptidase/acylaminoacyl peptidase